MEGRTKSMDPTEQRDFDRVARSFNRQEIAAVLYDCV